MNFIKSLLFDYDGKISWMGLVIVVLLIIVVFMLVFIIIDSVRTNADVNKFFNTYETDSGIVQGYEYVEEHTSTILVPSTVGKTIVNTPRIIHYEDEYFINIRCSNREKEFIATYKIPESDYEVYDVGSIVKVKDNWYRHGYSVLED